MSDITRFPLCYPDNVPRTAPHLRGTPHFKERTIDSAVRFALEEINRLNGRRWDYEDESVIVSSNLRYRADGQPYSNQSAPVDSGIAIYFNLRFTRNGKWYERPCVLTCDKWRKVHDNIHAIGKDIEAQRARQRWGCTNIEQAFRGYLAIPEKCGGKSWWELLKLPSTANEFEIKDLYYALAKGRHPDVGGDREKWAQLQDAYDQAMASFKHHSQ